MLPADTSGKINYSPGTFRPVRKFGSCTARLLAATKSRFFATLRSAQNDMSS